MKLKELFTKIENANELNKYINYNNYKICVWLEINNYLGDRYYTYKDFKKYIKNNQSEIHKQIQPYTTLEYNPTKHMFFKTFQYDFINWINGEITKEYVTIKLYIERTDI